MRKFTPNMVNPLSLGGTAASVRSRSDRVVPVFRQEESPAHWSCPSASQVWDVAEPPGMMGGGVP